MTVSGSGKWIRNLGEATGTDCFNSVDDLHWRNNGSSVFADTLTPVVADETLLFLVWISGPVYFGSTYFETLFFNDEVIEGAFIQAFMPDDFGDPVLTWPFIFWGRGFFPPGDYPARVVHTGPEGDGGILALHVPTGCYREQVIIGGT